jgi:integrase
LLSLRPVTPAKGAVRDLVFTNHGKVIRYIYDAWREAAKRAGLPGVLLHDCRRTAVRNFNRAGVPDKVAMAISGHKTRSVFDRYNIVDERDLRDATAKLERHLRGALGTVWAQYQQLQPQPQEEENGDSIEGKTVTH